MKLDKNKFFHDAVLRICGSLEIDVVAEDCLDFLKNYIPLDGISIHYYDEKNGAIIFLATTTKMPLNLEVTSVPISHAGDQMFKDTKDTFQIYNNPEDGPVPLAIWRTLGCLDKSSLVLFATFKGKRLGQIDFFCKGRNRYTTKHAWIIKQLYYPFSMAIANSLQYREIVNIKTLLAEDNRHLRQELQRRQSSDEIVAAKGGLRHVMEAVDQVAPLNSQVLLGGETGVGKEVIANAIHYLSPRKAGPFIKINCGAIPEGLIDSELFGHAKGAFTGAVSQKPGYFERADKGTIFLDEVGDLPAQAQISLLRVLQEKEIERVGGTRTVKVDVRVIAATNVDLEAMVKEGRFRKDLWFRLNVFPIVIPPLRERKFDIPYLLTHFLRKKSREMNINVTPTLAPGTIDQLMEYEWPGNVRELENVIERALIKMRNTGPKKPLVFDVLPRFKSPSGRQTENAAVNEPESGDDLLDTVMRHHIESVLKKTHGRIQGPGGAADLLGVKPNTLRHRMRKLGIAFGRKA